MAGICFDTSIFIKYKSGKIPAGFVLSAVVVQEMATGAAGHKELQYWRLYGQGHEKNGTLLVPTGEDWWLAGKILNSLLRGEKQKAGGKTPKLHPDDKHRLVRDILIAVTVKRADAELVTDNTKDFKRISRYCNLRYISGQKHFGYDPNER